MFVMLQSNQKGRLLKKLQTESQKFHSNIKQIMNQQLPHVNERPRKTKYLHKHRTLVFSTRGINQRMRHFMNDLRELLPHSKKEPKYDNKQELNAINEICFERGCNSCIFLESRRHTDLYMWLGKSPNGPSMKFLCTNVHTMDELRLTGNCLKGSRALLVFDAKFNDSLPLQLTKEMLTQIFGTPRGHPRSKPFVDHVFSFMIVDHKIWFRNYQIVYEPDNNQNANAKQDAVLVEIGPRFVLHPVRIQRGAFHGSTIFQSQFFINPNAQRRGIKSQKRLISSMKQIKQHSNLKSKYLNKTIQKLKNFDKQNEWRKTFQNDDFDLGKVFDQGFDFINQQNNNNNNNNNTHTNDVAMQDVDDFLAT